MRIKEKKGHDGEEKEMGAITIKAKAKTKRKAIMKKR